MLQRYFALVVCLFSTLSFLAPGAPGAEKEPWQDITTVTDTVSAFPEKMRQLMESLDLTRKGLKEVREAWKDDNLEEACRALLDYYRTGDTAKWLRPADDASTPKPRSRNIQIADDVVERDVYRGFGEKGRVPREESGHMVWSHTGPKDDLQFRARLNRHSHLKTLLHAYKSTGKQKYLKRLDMDLRDWLIASEGKPSREGLGSHLEPANRLPTWARVFYALQNEKGFRPSTRLLLLATIPRHARYLLKHPGGGNWVTMTQRGALICGVCWPEFKHSERWRKKGFVKLQENANESVYPDGAQKELTAAYHMVSLKRYSRCIQLLRRAGCEVPADFVQTVRNMWNYIAYLVRPDGTRPMNNDSGLRSQRNVIRKAAREYDRPDWLYIATNGQKGEKPEAPPSRFFPYAGQLISRSGWDENAQWSFFDIGPWGLGHQHNDHGHISIMASGRHLLVDTGRFAYQGRIAEKYRDAYAHHTRGHNTIMVDGHGQSNYQRTTDHPHPFRSINNTFDFAVGTFRGGYKSVEQSAQHTRATLYLRGLGWIVTDYVKVAGQHEVRPLWHFHPNCTVTTEEGSVLSTDADKGNLRITPIRSDQWDVDLARGRDKPTLQGWYSRNYGDAEPSTCAVYRGHITDAATFGWVMNTTRGIPHKPTVDRLKAPEGVARMNVQLPDGPEYTITTVLDDSVLPLDLPDGRILTARLLLEQKGRQPRVACGFLRDQQGTIIASDPPPKRPALQKELESIHFQARETSSPQKDNFSGTIECQNSYFSEPMKLSVSATKDTAPGWELDPTSASIEVRPGKRGDVDVRAVWNRQTPRYPLPAFKIRLSLPESDIHITKTVALPPSMSQPTLKMRKLAEAPKIDGRIAGAEWGGEPQIPSMGRMDRSREVNPNTRAWLGATPDALFIAFRCAEPAISELKLNENRPNDKVYLDDSVEIMVNGGKQAGQAFHQIVINSGNTAFSQHSEKGPVNLDGLQTAVNTGEDAWTAEIKIPWDDLGYAAPPSTINLLLGRNRWAEGEREIFQFPVSPQGNHQPEFFAQVQYGQ